MITIQLPRPFHVPRTLSFLQHSALRTPYHFVDPRRVRRLVRLDGRPRLVDFSFPTTARTAAHLVAPSPHLRITVVAAAADPRQRPGGSGPIGPALQRLATTVWSLDVDLQRCYRVFRRDPLMNRVLARCRGLRMIRTPDLYEALMIAVVNQQVSVAAAESIRRRLYAGLGDRLTRDGVTYLGCPPPRRLLSAGTRELRALGLSRQKARYLREVAERAVTGALDPAAFDDLDDEAAITKLTEIPGVGRWTAEVVLMRGLGRVDVFPAGDLGLVVAAQRVLERKDRPTEDELRAMAESWRGWRSYGALYLWRSLGIVA
jgi:DNA-3-methyladenine glycosylase II